MNNPDTGFLLHVFHRHQRGRYLICAIGRLENGETFAFTDDRRPPSFFVRQSDETEIKHRAADSGHEVASTGFSTMNGEEVLRVTSTELRTHRSMADKLSQEGIRTYEADLNTGLAYLVDQPFRGSLRIQGSWRQGDGVDRVYTNPDLAATHWEPELSVLSIDIETSAEADRVYSIALVGRGGSLNDVKNEIHLVGDQHPSDPPGLVCHDSERDLLEASAHRIRQLDPDIITGWNVIDFDLPVLARRSKALGLPFNFGRTRDDSWYSEGTIWGGSRMVIYGRQVLDALHLVRGTMARYDDFRLDTVARSILGRGKTLEAATDETMAARIQRAYEDDRNTFCQYCMEDAILVQDILESEGLIQLSVRRSLLTGLPLERAWGSVAAFDIMYINGLHSRSRVAPTIGVDRAAGGGSPGGLILAPRAGLYRHIFVFDFQSLYPSIIRTFNIDPLAYTEGRAAQADGRNDAVIVAPNGAPFFREAGVLPEILERFFASRAEAKRDGDDLASFAYKIIMNACYGVLATEACRFSDPHIVSAITEFGHYLLRWVEAVLEEEGLRVIYGDTDSLFVDSGLSDDTSLNEAFDKAKSVCQLANSRLQEHIEVTYGVPSRLELEFEKYYRRFLLPSGRGERDRGRAKGYAGLRERDGQRQLEIVGMEAVRRDWTDMAHGLQRSLLSLLFQDRPASEMEDLVFSWVSSVRNGNRDSELIYRKSLRKPVSEYKRNIPPHVRAAKLLPKPSGVIHYAITTNGPQPVGYISAPLDYDHYVSKQIEPLVRTVAEFCDLDIDAAVLGRPRLL